MDEASSFVFDFFAERHIALKQEWLSNVLVFLLTSVEKIANPKQIATLVFEQWKYASLEESTYPTLSQLRLDNCDNDAPLYHPLVLQINSVVDVGTSLHFQFTTLVYEFVDNSGFEPLPEMESGGRSDIWEKPRRMLLLKVSDGETEFKAVEYRLIKELSLLVKPGCKILLIPPVRCRKNVFLLNPENIQIIGGDVESLFEIGRPLQVIARRLNVTIPNASSNRVTERRQSQLDIKASSARDSDSEQHSSANNHRDETDSVISSADKSDLLSPLPLVYGRKRYTGKPATKSNLDNRECFPSFKEALAVDVKDNRATSCSEGAASTTLSHLRSRLKPVAQVSPLHQIPQSSSVELEESPPDFDAELERLRATASASSQGEKDANIGKIIRAADGDATSHIGDISMRNTNSLSKMEQNLRVQGSFHQSLSTKRDKQEEWQASLNKKVKVEVITLEDDENKLSCISSETTASTTYATQMLSQASQQRDDRPDLVSKFCALNIVRLADATRSMRFAVGSCRKTVQAIVVDIVESLRIVDGMWTMKVTVQDESTDSLLCIIDNTSLTSLIGLTPKEAMEVRTSNDVSRRRDGQRRLAAVEAQLKRLDLVLELELFSGGRADPVIRSIRTLMQALDIL